ncbi:unnamed protein product [Cuscuta epithymum]|uniref:BZIP domain-containing protein n=1 Tax=Cuscuta epithymum TaxID=186058 RepID=A0AAV0GDT0_9ASTE|nr:unnamed protein product [Cuscuta epithymum]
MWDDFVSKEGTADTCRLQQALHRRGRRSQRHASPTPSPFFLLQRFQTWSRMGSYLNFKNSGEAPLSRETSIYSLTFDELQSTNGGFGKDFGSMNMEDLMKNIWTAEEESNQPLASPAPNSFLAIPRTLSQKTVDDVWKDFQKETVSKSYGEITLEDFLVRAGVVREDRMVNSGGADSAKQEQQLLQPPLYANQSTAPFVSPVVGISPPPIIPNSNMDRPSLSHSPYTFNEGGSGGSGRRGCGGSLEKVVERRRRRMIKNRESAARSRARKQAYTIELEAEVARQKEINAQLRKRQSELLEMQKELEEKPRVPRDGKLICLRRTLTGPV